MRDKKTFQEYMQRYRFNKRLNEFREKQVKCKFCDKILKTLHHIDENQANNRPSNLLPVCQEHHLQIKHSCDFLPKEDLSHQDASILHRKGYPAVYSSKKVSDYLQNSVNNKIIGITIRNPNNLCEILIIDCSIQTVHFLEKLGYSEIINK